MYVLYPGRDESPELSGKKKNRQNLAAPSPVNNSEEKGNEFSTVYEGRKLNVDRVMVDLSEEKVK